jgi:hypothetical protein
LSAPGRWAAGPSKRPSRAAVLFVCLFAAALIAAAIVAASRTSDLVLEVARDLPEEFSPDGDGRDDTARITFFVRESDPHASVFIVGKDLAPIRALDEDVALEADKRVTYVWNGRTDSGQPAPIGRYRLRVVLPDHDRDMVYPARIDVVRHGVEPHH